MGDGDYSMILNFVLIFFILFLCFGAIGLIFFLKIDRAKPKTPEVVAQIQSVSDGGGLYYYNFEWGLDNTIPISSYLYAIYDDSTGKKINSGKIAYPGTSVSPKIAFSKDKYYTFTLVSTGKNGVVSNTTSLTFSPAQDQIQEPEVFAVINATAKAPSPFFSFENNSSQIQTIGGNICQYYGADLATYEQLQKAYETGASWACYPGVVSESQGNGKAYYPSLSNEKCDMNANNALQSPGIVELSSLNQVVILCNGIKPSQNKKEIGIGNISPIPGVDTLSVLDFSICGEQYSMNDVSGKRKCPCPINTPKGQCSGLVQSAIGSRK